MPLELGAGFDHAIFDTDVFDAVPDTAGFETKLEADDNNPILRLTLGGTAYDDFIIDAPSVARGADIVAGTVNIVMSNTAIAQIHGVGFAFVDSDPDTITDSNNGFVTAGFVEGDRITVSGSTSNDGTYHIASVAAGTLTLIALDSLAAEGAGDTVSILAQPAFNFFLEDRKKYMGFPAILSLLFSGTTGSLHLLTGTVEDVSYRGATVTLSIRDAMAPMLERRIGSGQAPADFYTTVLAFNPADLVWGLLTVWGGLDNTFNSDNVDINFDDGDKSWSAWRIRCSAHNYSVRARFPGTTVQNALLRIADMVNSFFWVDGAGKFQFVMYEPPYSASPADEEYDEDNSINIDMDITRGTVRNVVDVYFGHDPDFSNQPEASVTSTKIAFGNDDPDRIYFSAVDEFNGFLVNGFDIDDPIEVSGSEKNSGKFDLQSVTDLVMTLTGSSGFTDEQNGASITITQSQDTSTIRSTSLVFNSNAGNDTITDVTGGFVIGGINANDSISIAGSASNNDTYIVDSVTANTITLDAAETLVQEASGSTIILTQTHSISYTATTIGFDDEERPPDPGDPWDFGAVDHVFDTVAQFINEGFLAQYDITISGAANVTNDGTYTLGSVTTEKLNLLKQTLHDEAQGQTVTITQSHGNRTTGKQFEAFVRVIDDESINLYGGIILTDEDKVVWHDDQQSAAAAGAAKILIYAFPGEFIKVNATMEGFLTEPGDEIRVTEGLKNLTGRVYFVKGTDLDIEQGVANITGERGSETG